MILLEVLVVLVLAIIFFLAPAIVIRALARIPFFWTFTPANTFVVVVTEEDASGDGMKGAGNVVNALHAVPGKVLKKSDSDQMKWEFMDGEDPEHGFLFRTLGIQSMGSIFYTTRVNIDRRLRFSREDVEDLHTITKTKKTRSVFYTGELTVKIKEADTADKLGLNFEIDFVFARQFPVRSVLRLADSTAFLTSLVEKIVNNTTVALPAEAYVGGTDAQKNRRRLIRIIETDRDFKKKILDEIGLEITTVSLRDVSMIDTQRELLQKKITAEKEAEAKVIEAGGDRDAQIARNTGDADRVTRVIVPASQDERTVAIRVAEAYENNPTVTTYAPGADKMIPLGGGGKP